jgi:hypothetical protein
MHGWRNARSAVQKLTWKTRDQKKNHCVQKLRKPERRGGETNKSGEAR